MTIEQELQSIYYVIEQKVDEYRKKYGQPEFIKIPSWMYSEIIMSANYTMLFDRKHGKLFGLTVCPTNSIQQFDEIEVF